VATKRGTFRPRLEALEDRCLLSAGALDPTFGSGGMVSGPVAPGPRAGLAIYPNTGTNPATDGKIVVASSGPNFTVARYTSSGALDTTFGSGGTVQTVVGTSSSYGIFDVALQSDGKIVAVGEVQVQVGVKGHTVQYAREIALVRYNLSGSLDTTFGSGGIVLTAHLYSGLGAGGSGAVAIQADGKIDVACKSDVSGTNFALARYLSSGALDTTFGPNKNGIVITPMPIIASPPLAIVDQPNAISIQPDGKIVLAGRNDNLAGVVRYLPSGALDSSFGAGGIVGALAPSGSTIAYPYGVLVQNSGTIVFSGFANFGGPGELMLGRLRSSGQLDTSFGASGFAINSSMIGFGMAQAADGDLLVAGYPADPNATPFIGVAAYLPGGARDASFGSGGIAAAYFSGSSTAHAVAVQGDGKIVVMGNVPGGTGLARFQAPNSKITSFTATPNPDAAGSSVTLSASGILNSNPATTIAQVAFYLDDGSGNLDPSTDTLLGYGSNINAVWSLTFTPMASGTFTLFAQAADSSGVLSDPVTVSLTVM
jgi:uncharacterized delta-60 repeat protein